MPRYRDAPYRGDYREGYEAERPRSRSNRSDSIFSGSDERSQHRDDDDRGFFDRARDEVRSWLGDEEAERRREQDYRRSGSGENGWGRDDYDSRREPWGGGDWTQRDSYGRGQDEYRSRGFAGSRSDRRFTERGNDYGPRDFGGRSGMLGRSQSDDNYLRWRQREIDRMDREYEEFCRDCDDKFEQDFQSWRTSRLTEGGPNAMGTQGMRTGTGEVQRAGTSTGTEAGRLADRSPTVAGEEVVAGTGNATSGATSETVSSPGRKRGRSES